MPLRWLYFFKAIILYKTIRNEEAKVLNRMCKGKTRLKSTNTRVTNCNVNLMRGREESNIALHQLLTGNRITKLLRAPNRMILVIERDKQLYDGNCGIREGKLMRRNSFEFIRARVYKGI